ncbi:prolyl aminopeptidase [Kineosporia sp. NBRC 101731]|uniref:prolyl aminopeptidase n=1 Tax=Kineosporia sp. NBRC 101731 TaxID=3032199 RepID=UPI0024A36EB9|nr:prolyl aminopeptidase [Kineosporia sp. NBRC 101731]GLY29427.1 proline iminopeptidase [Kineosporia sp. NBRC 101731]
MRYPAIEPYASGHLEPGDGQEIYWETSGNPEGLPVVYLHGGPGSGARPSMREIFDPAVYRAVLFDQRGCGRSRPLAEHAGVDLSVNTTAHLLRDLEALRTSLGIDRWVVTGVSWGSSLALAYAQAHPDRVAGIVLMAVTAGRRRETEWITRGMRRLFPREWEEFAAVVPPGERDGDLAAAYARRLGDPDPAVVATAVQAWCVWEDTHTSLAPNAGPHYTLKPPLEQQVSVRLITHYWGNGCFLDDRPVLENMHRIAHIPSVLIHGRWDVSSPLDTAWDLHRAWPASRLVVIGDEGHGGEAMMQEWIRALDEMAGTVSQTVS